MSPLTHEQEQKALTLIAEMRLAGLTHESIRQLVYHCCQDTKQLGPDGKKWEIPPTDDHLVGLVDYWLDKQGQEWVDDWNR